MHISNIYRIITNFQNILIIKNSQLFQLNLTNSIEKYIGETYNK